MPVSRDAKWTVQASRGAQYGAEDAGRYRTHPAGRDEARAVLEAGESGTGALSEGVAALPGDAGSDLRQQSYWEGVENGIERNPVKLVSTRALSFLFQPKGLETSSSMLGHPELSKDPITMSFA